MSAGADRGLRVAFRALGSARWTGGLVYQLNLLQVLKQYAPEVEVVVVGGESGNTSGGGYKTARYPSAQPGSVLGWAWNKANNATRRLWGYDVLLRQALRSASIDSVDMVFPDHCSSGRRMARLAWIADFQYLRLPGMFSPADVHARNVGYRRMIEQATLVVLSSRDARNDYNQFTRRHQDKARVMNFVATVPPAIYQSNPREVTDSYGLPDRFFFLPNQFWKHKNHGVVWEALRRLKEQGIRPFVVCTGNLTDYRNPAYLAEVIQAISAFGLRDQVAILGLVPHDHVYQFIRQAVCVVNPSFFEGWSTTVEEAKSVGKRVLLSDLGVHREQNAPKAAYFDPGNAADLAARLGDTWATAAPGPDPDLERSARDALPDRMRLCAGTFVAIAREAVDKARRG